MLKLINKISRESLINEKLIDAEVIRVSKDIMKCRNKFIEIINSMIIKTSYMISMVEATDENKQKIYDDLRELESIKNFFMLIHKIAEDDKEKVYADKPYDPC